MKVSTEWETAFRQKVDDCVELFKHIVATCFMHFIGYNLIKDISWLISPVELELFYRPSTLYHSSKSLYSIKKINRSKVETNCTRVRWGLANKSILRGKNTCSLLIRTCSTIYKTNTLYEIIKLLSSFLFFFFFPHK